METRVISQGIVRISSLATGVHLALVVVVEEDVVVPDLGHADLAAVLEAGGVAAAAVADAHVAVAPVAVQGEAAQEAEVKLNTTFCCNFDEKSLVLGA